jgi:hypothetical protein
MSFNPLTWLAHKIDTKYEPAYALLQKRLRDEAGAMQLLSIVGITASAVTLFFGMKQNNISLVLVSGVFGYVSYNIYQVSQNYYKVAEKPNDFDKMFGWSDVFGKRKQDNPKLKQRLEKNTFCFGLFVDFVVKHVINVKQ